MTLPLTDRPTPRLVSDNPEGTEIAKRTEPKNEKTKHPGVYRRGKRYVYTYRLDGKQRWGSAASLEEAWRRKREAEVDASRGELVDLTDAKFGDYAREWIALYQGRTSRGFRESTRRSYRQMLDDRIIPYFDGVVRRRLAEIQPRDIKAYVRWLVEQRDPRTGRLLGKSTITHPSLSQLRHAVGCRVSLTNKRALPAGIDISTNAD